MKNELANALGLETTENTQVEVVKKPTQEIMEYSEKEISDQGFVEEDRQEDYNKSRKAFEKIVSTGNDAIDALSKLAEVSEDPKMYEALSSLIKAVTDSTNSMYDIHKKTKDLHKKDGSKGNATNIEKAVFVGTPTELLRKMKNEKV